MTSTKNEITLKTFNLLNVAPATFVSETVLKNTDKDIKDLRTVFTIIMTTIKAIEFMKDNNVFNPSYFGDGYKYSEDNNNVGHSIFSNLTPKLIRSINDYNVKLKNLSDRNVKLPKDISSIEYTETKYNTGKSSAFTYVKPTLSDYTDIINSRIFSKVSDLTKLADIFGFVIMPLSIAKETIYSCDPFRNSDSIKTAIREYKKFNSKRELYVLCPLDFYDLMQHAKAEKYHQVYFPKSLPYIGMNIGMSLPLFRTIFESVGILDQRVTKLENNVDIIKKQIYSIETNIKILQTEVAKIAQTQVNLRTQLIEQEQSFKQYKVEMKQEMARMIDPLLFSVEKSIEDFETPTSCQLAFAWGTEFPEEFINMLGVKAITETKNIWLK